ncbi:MAG: XRE family transcriptional regulator, partial [Frankiales bacterium]
MRLPEMLRDARHRRHLSIRAAAERCDVPRTTWASWESGRAAPPADRLDAVLRDLCLDLLLVDRPAEPPGEARVAEHLRKSLTVRAATALGDQLDRVVVAARRQLVGHWPAAPRPLRLTGPAAAGIWVPHVVARGPLPLPAADPKAPGLVPVH